MAEKSSKQYNVPSAVTEEVRRRERAKREREDAERSTDSDVSAADKAGLKRLLQEEGEEEYGDTKSQPNPQIAPKPKKTFKRDPNDPAGAMNRKNTPVNYGSSDEELRDRSALYGEEEMGFKRGGSVRKYAEGGLVRGSVRGGGVALRGLGKGKVY
jgi:hypothetical protein